MKVNLAFVLFFTFCSNYCYAENLKLLLLHNNDMHSRFDETSRISGTCKSSSKTKNCVGGFARLAHVIREARRAADEGNGPKVLFLNAGDTYAGTAWYNVHKWKIVSELLNILRPDVMSFGNHEFDDGIKGLLPFINAATFPIVAANLDYSQEPSLQATNVSKSVVLEVEGRKIGVIGYLTRETQLISMPEKIIFKDEVESINNESRRLDQDGVKIIIALGHSGFETDKKIAKNCPLVDVVIGGHTNTFLWNGPPPDLETPEGDYPTIIKQTTGKKVPVVQAYAYTKYLGQLNVTFDDNGDLTDFSGQPLLIRTGIPQDKDVADVVDRYRIQLNSLTKEVVGKTRVLLDASEKSCRAKECNFGNLIADAYVAYHASVYAGSYWTDTPIALMNGGGIRFTIDPATASGNISRGELLSAMPFENQVVSMSLKGSDIIKTLELGVRNNGETSSGEFLQVSGLHVVYDMSKPTGERVVTVRARCGLCSIPKYETLEEDKVYRVIVNGFLNGGGDGHYIIQKKGYDKKAEDLNDIDMVAWYLNKHSPVFPGIEERIVFQTVGSGRSDARLNVGSVLLSVFVYCILTLFR